MYIFIEVIGFNVMFLYNIYSLIYIKEKENKRNINIGI